MNYTEDPDSRWERRDSKKSSRKRFLSDNRKSVRWLAQNTGQQDTAKSSSKRKGIRKAWKTLLKKARKNKERERCLLN